MSKFICSLSLISFVSFYTGNFSYAFDFNTVNLKAEFGLQPTTSQKSQKKSKKTVKSVLPYCEDIQDLDSAPGVSAHKGYCLGNVDYDAPAEREPALSIISEIFDDRGFTRIIKRNPILMGLTAFLSVCRPMGGSVSTDKLYCEYYVEF